MRTISLAVLWALMWAAIAAGACEPGPVKPEPAPTRVALLYFGVPPELADRSGDAIGRDVRPDAWRRAVKMLEADRTEVVILVVESGGGCSEGAEEFQRVFQDSYKPRFRVVAWIDQAIGNAAMAVLPIEEYVFRSTGVWARSSGAGKSHAGWLEQCEQAARWGNRSPALPRTHLRLDALSVERCRDGTRVWRGDEQGDVLLNRRGEWVSVVAFDAVRTGLATGVADVREDLLKVLGIERVEWVGEAAAAAIEADRIDAGAACARFDDAMSWYLSKRHQPEHARLSRREINEMRSTLRLLRRLADELPGMAKPEGYTAEWFDAEATWLDARERDLPKVAGGVSGGAAGEGGAGWGRRGQVGPWMVR
jgi:hypothetical protein